YRDNDLGDYNEVSLAFFVHRRGERAGVPYLSPALDFVRNRVATYIWKLPVDQRFTCAAGRGIWGFPKSVEQIAFEDVGGRRRCRLVMDGRHVLTFSVSRGGARRRRLERQADQVAELPGRAGGGEEGEKADLPHLLYGVVPALRQLQRRVPRPEGGGHDEALRDDPPQQGQGGGAQQEVHARRRVHPAHVLPLLRRRARPGHPRDARQLP